MMVMVHELCSLIFLVGQFIVNAYLNVAGLLQNDVSVSYSVQWNQGVYTMASIFYICMGTMIG